MTLSESKVGLVCHLYIPQGCGFFFMVSGEAVSLAVLRSYTEVADHLKGKVSQFRVL